MMHFPFSDTELLRAWAKHQSGGQLSASEITRLFDTLIEKNGRFEFVAKAVRDSQKGWDELRFYVESWARDAENDLVLNNYLVIQLLDKIHPHWRRAFDVEFEPTFVKLGKAEIVTIIRVADGTFKSKDVYVEPEED